MPYFGTYLKRLAETWGQQDDNPGNMDKMMIKYLKCFNDENVNEWQMRGEGGGMKWYKIFCILFF